MNILCLSDSIVTDPFNGGSLRLWNLLSRGNADVFYLTNQKKNNLVNKRTLNWKSISQVKISNSFEITKADIFPNNFFNKNKSNLKLVEEIIKQYLVSKPDTVIIVYGHKLGLLTSKIIPGQFVFDGCDSMGLYYRRRYQALSLKEWKKKTNSLYMSAVYNSIESYIARRATLYLVPAKADKQWIEKYCSKTNVIAVGNGTEWIDLPPIKTLEDKAAPTIAFHGGMTWEPNRSAVLYLIHKVFPKIKTVIPNVKLKIAGAPIFDELSTCKHLDGVEICGFVDDIRQWLGECDVYAMPMLQGSGVKNKLIEVMAAGLPIVTNSLGVEALSLDAKQSVVVADGTTAIASAITNLLQNKAARISLGKKARIVAEGSFQWQSLSQKLMQEIELTNYSITR